MRKFLLRKMIMLVGDNIDNGEKFSPKSLEQINL